MKQDNPWLMLVMILAVTFGVAAVGGAVTGPAVRDWYPSLAKPSWNPPSWVFGPVWTALYTMMAIAAWIVWRRAGWNHALLFYGIQLALNAVWTPLFFGLHRLDLAFVDIVALWVGIVLTTAAFWKISLLAGVLFVPYLAWVSFAGVLNFVIWRLNPQL
ncbi:MAG: tryptophan-rich sensory protein [Acidobacteriota bacterium]|jgi:benzodiazapine receptor